eukprot:1623083-Rhodomonas_salina.2
MAPPHKGPRWERSPHPAPIDARVCRNPKHPLILRPRNPLHRCPKFLWPERSSSTVLLLPTPSVSPRFRSVLPALAKPTANMHQSMPSKNVLAVPRSFDSDCLFSRTDSRHLAAQVLPSTW